MNQVVNEHTLLFVRSIQIGIIMGAGYDIVRVIRKIIKHYNWMVQVEDILYWLVCSFMSFLLLYTYNYAQIKLFCFVGIVLGGILYFCTFSIVFMRMMEWLIELTRKIIKLIIHILKVPLMLALNLIIIPIRYALYLLKKIKGAGYKSKKQFKRKWYHKKADIITGIKLNKSKKF